MTNISVDFHKKTKNIKPMHAIGQPPLRGTNTQMFQYLKDANIPYSRLHDVGGRFGGNLFVDIPNIFRDFNADENNPDSYDFVFTDLLISELIKYGCEPIYRLGVSIENFHYIKAYRIYPPKDMDKWARICEHIVRHYNEGWADGFRYNIKYWEIWNEPDGHFDLSENAMWQGTIEEYFELYRVTSKHLKKCFGDSIKIGGYSSCGFYKVNVHQSVSGEAFGSDAPLSDWDNRINYFMEFFHKFIDVVTKEKLPFEFFSYHSYTTVKDNINMQRYAEEYLEKVGLGNVEIHLNEWNTNPHIQERGTSLACANAVALMCAMQNTKMNMMCYYDARVGESVYGGLFDPRMHLPLCTYYGFKAFGKLYKIGKQTESICDNDNIYVLSASNGKDMAVLVSNIGEDDEVVLNVVPDMTVYLIDEEHFFEKTDLNPNKFTIKKNQAVYVTTEKTIK